MTDKKRRKVDAKTVFDAVQSGRVSKDAMAGYGLGKSQKTPRKKRKSPGEPVAIEIGPPLGDIAITKNGSLVLPRNMVEKLGFRVDDVFVVRKTKSGIILKPV
ncbi:MAG: AbrB/MazE/SpoVT family DNA-binding domain-containing protein [Pseudomonadota bacterium]